MDNTVEIIKPAIFTDKNSYWAMHYCAILETIYEQKTLSHGFQSSFMSGVEPTLGNLVNKAGFGFFNNIQQSLQNFGLQTLICHFLTSSEGHEVYKNIVLKISELYNYDFLSETQQYGVFVSGKDFLSGLRFAQQYNPELIGFNKITLQEAGQHVSYADLCIVLKGEEKNFGLLGEVEGNYGEKLMLESFWGKKKGSFYSFGIGVKTRVFRHLDHNALPPNITGQWVETNQGTKYIVIIESDHWRIKDFHNAIGTMKIFMTLGPLQRSNYDPTLLPVINKIKQSWDFNILDLMADLRVLINPHSLSSLGTNKLDVKVIPTIII